MNYSIIFTSYAEENISELPNFEERITEFIQKIINFVMEEPITPNSGSAQPCKIGLHTLHKGQNVRELRYATRLGHILVGRTGESWSDRVCPCSGSRR